MQRKYAAKAAHGARSERGRWVITGKRGLMYMESGRVRIVDIADELGVSTATVSNVIHGKTKQITDETVKREQLLLEDRQ